MELGQNDLFRIGTSAVGVSVAGDNLNYIHLSGIFFVWPWAYNLKPFQVNSEPNPGAEKVCRNRGF